MGEENEEFPQNFLIKYSLPLGNYPLTYYITIIFHVK